MVNESNAIKIADRLNTVLASRAPEQTNLGAVNRPKMAAALNEINKMAPQNLGQGPRGGVIV